MLGGYEVRRGRAATDQRWRIDRNRESASSDPIINALLLARAVASISRTGIERQSKAAYVRSSQRFPQVGAKRL
jgi:hypothetical protein